jgi:hypothetical protein
VTGVVVVAGSVPTTVEGSGWTTFSPGFDVEQPARTKRSGTASSSAERRIGR